MIPFFGVVEDVQDPLQIGRMKVRAHNVHTPNAVELPTDILPWMTPVVNNSIGVDGFGDSATGYEVGSTVFGMFLDDMFSTGVILGSIAGTNSKGHDTDDLARGIQSDTVIKQRSNTRTDASGANGSTWTEPESSYAAKYPDNRVFKSKSGHIMEFDDTSGAERIHIFHKNGSFIEIQNDATVIKLKGSKYLIVEDNEFVRVGGDLDLVVDESIRVKAKDMYVESPLTIFDGNVFVTKDISVVGVSRAKDHISSGVSGKTHTHGGIMPGPASTAVPNGADSSLIEVPGVGSEYILHGEDAWDPAFAVSQGYVTQEQIDYQVQAGDVVAENKEDVTKDVSELVAECGLVIDENNIDYNMKISNYFRLNQLTTDAAVSNYTVRPQRGLSPSEIVCNLKFLATNTLDKIKEKYPSVMVTSGFRHGNGTSQHELGQAVDLQFQNTTKDEYYNIAVWIKDNVVYDQLILEYKNFGSGLPWIHITFAETNRNQTMTFFNHSKYGDTGTLYNLNV